MILVDASLWIEHLRSGHGALAEQLEDGRVSCHPFVIGELACGHLTDRETVIALLRALPTVETTDHEEVLKFIDMHELAGSGLGYVDMHLLGSAMLSGTPLWTLDRGLRKAARRLGVEHVV